MKGVKRIYFFLLIITVFLIFSACNTEKIYDSSTDVDMSDIIDSTYEETSEEQTDESSYTELESIERDDSDTYESETVIEDNIDTDVSVESDIMTEAESNIEDETATNEIDQRYFIFRIWNFDILSMDEFKSTVNRVILDGFNAIKIHIPWHHVETVSGVYNYDPFDPMLDYVINEKGLKVAVSVDLTRLKGDAVLTDDDIMRDVQGNLCIGGSAPGNRMQISLNSEEAVDKAVAFYRNIVEHFNSLYGDDILFYLPAFSQYAESEYWCTTAYDYSDNAVNAFREFLARNYESIDVLNNIIDTNYSSFADVVPPTSVTSDDFGQLWYVFRHQSLKGMLDKLADAQKAVAPNSKFSVQFGGVWDNNAILRGTLGFVDLCEKVDVLWVDDGPVTNHRFSMDYLLTALPDHIELAQEIDGPYHSVATPELYLGQGLQCFERGATYMSIANWFINNDYERYCYAWREIADTWIGDDVPALIKPTEDSPVIEISLLDLFRKRNISNIVNMYDYLAKNGEAVRIEIVDDLTSYIPQEKTVSSVFPGNFSSVQGEHGWYYKSYSDGNFVDMTYDAANDRWQGEAKYTLIMNGYIHPDAYDAALVYKADTDGKLVIDISCLLPTAQSDGVVLYMLHNGKRVNLGENKKSVMISPNIPYDSTVIVTVKAGDEIAIVINRGNTNTSDSTYVSVYVEKG